jgi:hypothetical protein
MPSLKEVQDAGVSFFTKKRAAQAETQKQSLVLFFVRACVSINRVVTRSVSGLRLSDMMLFMLILLNKAGFPGASDRQNGDLWTF